MSLTAIRFDTLGLPIINNETMVRPTGGQLNDSHLIINILINIFIFLTVLLWFTLCFNIATRGWMDNDQQFTVFAIAFTLFTFLFVYLLLKLKKIDFM